MIDNINLEDDRLSAADWNIVELMHRKKSDDLIASIYMGELLTI